MREPIWAVLRQRLLWHSGAIIIGYTNILHLVWAGLLVRSDLATHPTPLYWLLSVLGTKAQTAAALIAVAMLAFCGAFFSRSLAGLALMLPQQIVVTISALGALYAATHGVYPDGYMAPALYIWKDQLPTILLAPAYTLGVLIYHNVFRHY